MLNTPFVLRLTSLSRRTKQALVVGVDTVMALITTWIGFSVRFDMFFMPWTTMQLAIFALSPALAIPIFMRCGLYRAIFRYSGFGATAAIVRAVSIYTVVFAACVLILSFPDVPRTISVIQPALFAWAVLAVRAFTGALLVRSPRESRRGKRERLLIFGAGVSGIQTCAALTASNNYEVVGFIEDDREKIGRQILGVDVFGRDDLSDLIAKHSIDGVLLAMPRLSRIRRNDILELLRPHGLHIRSIPSVLEIASGKVTLNDIRELDVEDLLGRCATPVDFPQLRSSVAGATVMVTGAGGSIGSELSRQLLQNEPATLLLVESSEYALYSIHRDLVHRRDIAGFDFEIVPLLCDVRDLTRMTQLCQTWRPSTVYHAAAYKHVPLVEQNIAEGVMNNVIGTLNTAQAAIVAGVSRFVLISTDKAVRPPNIMGATKRFAELVLQALAAEQKVSFIEGGAVFKNQTVFTMVRFGNVLGSSGSVVPLFRSQLALGGPITVTHPDVTRYFMTIPEAAQLVLQAGMMAQGGEVFLLDMGRPVKIFELARRVIELSGVTVRDEANPDGDISIEFTGLRPGEKLHEELLIGDDPAPTTNPRIMQARERMWPWKQVRDRLSVLRMAAVRNDVDMMRAALSEYVDGFEPVGEVVDCVHLARNEPIRPESSASVN